MTLSRSIETRLLEAVLIETVACFKRSDFAGAYLTNGTPKIYARPVRKNETVVPYQVNVVPLPPTWERDTSGVTNTIYAVEADFIFPFDLVDIVAGAGSNTFLDHIAAYRAWLVSGGTSASKDMSLIDPDAAGDPSKRIGRLYRFVQHPWQLAPQNAGVIIPVELGFETREDKAGVRA